MIGPKSWVDYAIHIVVASTNAGETPFFPYVKTNLVIEPHVKEWLLKCIEKSKYYLELVTFYDLVGECAQDSQNSELLTIADRLNEKDHLSSDVATFLKYYKGKMNIFKLKRSKYAPAAQKAFVIFFENLIQNADDTRVDLPPKPVVPKPKPSKFNLPTHTLRLVRDSVVKSVLYRYNDLEAQFEVYAPDDITFFVKIEPHPETLYKNKHPMPLRLRRGLNEKSLEILVRRGDRLKIAWKCPQDNKLKVHLMYKIRHREKYRKMNPISLSLVKTTGIKGARPSQQQGGLIEEEGGSAAGPPQSAIIPLPPLVLDEAASGPGTGASEYRAHSPYMEDPDAWYDEGGFDGMYDAAFTDMSLT